MNSPAAASGAILLAMSMVNRNALVTALSRAGWSVVGARSFDGAEHRLIEAGAGAAIVDLRDDGHAGLAAIRALSGRTSILAIVPGRDIKWVTAAIDAGATHYLTSPFPAVELAQAVRLLVQRPAALVQPQPQRPILDGVAATLAIDQRLREGPASALLVAATRFAGINAAYGREVGDELLGAVAQRIAVAAREVEGDATVARVSGAEFAIIVGNSVSVDLAHEVCTRIDRPFMAGGHIVSIGCRIGVVDSMPGESAIDLMRRASGALAEARSSDGAQIRILGSSESDAAFLDATLEADLRLAIEADEVDVLFQPQVEVASGRVIGVEALARWEHPRHGSVGAATLFEVAARSDYLVTLSQHVQRRALTTAAAWPHALAHLRVAINLTAADIAAPEFVRSFLTMVDETGLARDRLTVELTENGLIDTIETAAAVFAELRAGGVRVAIDDFGTGYSSLAWLKALPLDYLKIDKGLAQDIAGSKRDRIVVRGVIDMARSLGLAVVAEGVETEEQLSLLAAEGCNYWQGFLFAEALTSEALIERLS